MSDPATTQLLIELGDLISEYSKYETRDQAIVFGLVWVSILASAGAALLTALDKGSKILVTIVAVLPALCLTIESSFNFSHQYQLSRAATAAFLSVKDQLQYEGLSPAKGSSNMREIVSSFKTGSPVPTLSPASVKQNPSAPADTPK